jgi:PAS domain S-box-containing protein
MYTKELDLYRTLFHESRDGVYIVDSIGQILEFNQSALDILGYDKDEILGLRVTDFLADKKQLKTLLINLKEHGSIQDYIAKVKCKDGSVIDCLISATPYFEKGAVAAYLGIIRDVTEQQNARNILQEQRNLLRQVIDLNPSFIFAKDRNGRFVLANKGFANRLGKTPEELVGKTDAELMVDIELAEQHRANDLEIIETGKAFEYPESEYTFADGAVRWIQTTKLPIVDANGDVKHVLAISSDNTERRRVEDTLRESEARFRSLAEGSPDMIYLLELQSNKIIYANRKTFLGYDTYQSLHPYTHPDDLDFVTEHWQKVLSAQTAQPIEYRCRNDKDEWEWVQQRETILARDEDDKPTEILVILTVITERKQSELRLEQLSNAVEQSNNLVMITNLDGIIEYINPAFEAQTGYKKEFVIGKNPRFLKSGKHNDNFYRGMWARLNAGHPYHGVTINRKRNGDLYYEEKTITPIKTVGGKITHFLSTAVDITERVEMEEKLRASLERRSRQVQLATQVAQEIATAANLDELYQRVVNQIKEQFGYYHVQLLRYDPALDTIALVHGYGETGKKMLAMNHSMPLGVGVIGTVAATGQSILRPNIVRDSNWKANPLLPQTKGEMAIPIKMGDQVLGVLDIQSDKLNGLNEDDQLLLEGLCGQIAIAIESTNLRQEMESRLFELNLLQGQLSREGWNKYKQTQMAKAGYQFDHRGVLPVATFEDKPEDLEKESALITTNGNHSESGSNGHHESVAVPLMIRGQSIGQLAIEGDEENPLSKEDQDFLNAVTEEISEALEAARLFEETQTALAEQERLTGEMETVAQVSMAASTILESDTLLQSVVDLAKSSFGLYHAHVYLVDENRNTLSLKAGAGNVGRLMSLEGRRISISDNSLVARAARERKGVLENDVRKTIDFMPHPLLPHTRAEIAQPMVVGDKLIGVLDLQSDREYAFTDEDLQIHKILASQIAVAVQNASQYAEQVETASKLRELDQLKSEFLASMSHELRTPLNSIIGFADVLLEGLDGELNERMTEDVSLIKQSGSHLRTLIGDILDMSKIEAGRMELRYETIDIFQMAEDIMATTQPLATEKDLDLNLNIEGEVGIVEADRTRMRQVFLNIVSNAIKFTEKGGVTIGVREKAEYLVVSVRDTGIGIQEEHIPIVFEQFRQIDGGLNRSAGGTGLGMPITKKLVELHGGSIWVKSVVGQGSTFYFTIPYQKPVTVD